MLRRTHILATLALLAAPVAAMAQTFAAVPASGNQGRDGNFSTTLTTTPVLVFPMPALAPPDGGLQLTRHYQRIVVNGPASGSTIYCSRYNQTPSATDPSSFQLDPYGNPTGLPSVEEFSPPNLPPQEPLYCVAASGTVSINAEAF